ncbi:hypothetical protein GCM10028803_53100 [Larkinella knui]|uniref:Uncharacterized protein n=1 Tax=Larkinella knui TaxID=2025310 RepID=A0A3P1CHX1_9BACT|nr:hypothetical protein [Larkinella knui]RRB12484.1 hypothetical protein EHT87_19995 [Larkinella knui]
MPLTKQQYDDMIRLKAWIRHDDGTVNQTAGVFKWRTESQRATNIRAFLNKVVANYRGGTIHEIRFFDKEQGGAWVATWSNGNFSYHN